MNYPDVSRKPVALLLAGLCMVTMPLAGSAATGTSTKAQSSASAGASAMSASDFVENATQGGLFEVKTGQLAKQKSKNQDVQDFGDTLVEDHKALNTQILQYAKSNVINAPTVMNDKYERKYQKLGKMDGDKFNRAFVRGQIRGHKKMIKLFEHQANNGEDKKLQKIAMQALPTLKDHLEEAQDLKQEMHEQSGAANHSGGDRPIVGGAQMSPNKTIVQNASKADNLTTLVAAIKAAGLVETLSGEGPFTVFAPTNAAFEKLPKGTVDSLLKAKNKDKLTALLTYHVVPAKATSSAVVKMIKDDNGSHTVTTVQGGKLTLTRENGKVMVTDAAGNSATVTQADVIQSNGVVHVIDTVLMPGK